MIAYAEGRGPLPILLEMHWTCDAYAFQPAHFGFDDRDPRTIRGMRLASNLYEIVRDRRRAKKKSDWDKAHLEERKFLVAMRRLASESGAGLSDPSEIRVELPEKE